ncbi:hypothetical protein V1511DRAFT_337121 [Dipodascopsis uninucleata]
MAKRKALDILSDAGSPSSEINQDACNATVNSIVPLDFQQADSSSVPRAHKRVRCTVESQTKPPFTHQKDEIRYTLTTTQPTKQVGFLKSTKYGRDSSASLSNEALLLIFACLQSSDLASCACVSRKWNRLANDSLIWKRLFFQTFTRKQNQKTSDMKSDDRIILMENDEFLMNKLNIPDSSRRFEYWKAHYRLWMNWNIGRCRVNAVNLFTATSEANDIIVRYRDSNCFTVDSNSILRCWDKNGRLVSEVSLAFTTDDGKSFGPPTALQLSSDSSSIIVGFENGGFVIFDWSPLFFELKYIYGTEITGLASKDALTSIAYVHPFVISLSQNRVLGIFWFDSDNSMSSKKMIRQINSLRSHNITGVVVLAVRRVNEDIVLASVAYSHQLIQHEWTVTIQELELDVKSGTLSNVYVGTAYPSIALASKPPTAISYSEPYLVTSHSDNTLMYYLVTRAQESTRLNIQPVTSLYGHTSAVANVQVHGRGRAVSVSSNGSDIRIWELNYGIANVSMQVSPPSSGSEVGRFFGFDDERVVVEHNRPGGKVLMVYDFT